MTRRNSPTRKETKGFGITATFAVLLAICVPSLCFAQTAEETPVTADAPPTEDAPEPLPSVTPLATTTSAGAVAIDSPDVESVPDLAQADALGIGFALALGYHGYSGWHWKNAGAKDYNAPSIEESALFRAREGSWGRADGVLSVGYYSGSHCARDSATSCVSNSFTNLYVDIAPRLTWNVQSTLFVFGQAGVGMNIARYSYRIPEGDPNYTTYGGGSTSAHLRSAHVMAGAGVTLDSVILFVEGKYVSADGILPERTGTGGFSNARIPIGMGGQSLLVGALIRL